MAGKKKILIFVLIFIVLLAIGGFVLLSRKNKPASNKLLAYMEKAYGKDFEIIEEFTYISYTDGEPDVQREIQCPAVELQDKENSEIRCFVYAYPLESGGWTYENNYSRKILLYCIQQENLMIENEDECSSVTSFAYPRLILENTDETAQKLQNMVIQFNESYQYNDKYFHDSGSERFEVEGSIYMKSILAGDISDRWLGETGNFCYDTPIEKYKAFLEELEQEQEGDQKEELTADDLDGWIGEYTFSEYYENGDLAPQFWDYDIDIYKENGQYYADVEVNGHMVGINVKAQVYGDEEWISLVLMEYNPDHIMGISEMENNVILSLRKEEENLYTYWGILTPLWEAEGGVSVSGGSYLQRIEESDSMEQSEATDDIAQNVSDENVTDIADLSYWIGEYACSEGSSEERMDYALVIYEEEGEYYGDVVINGNDNTIDVKVRVYGDEEWISLVLVGYNPGHVTGLEGMENSVLFSLRKQKKDIYTYWGEEDVVINLIEGDRVQYDTIYYKSNQYFEKVAD